MDPNEVLKRILEHAKIVSARMLSCEHDLSDEEIQVQDLADDVCLLDHWITNGGFLPARWSRK